MLGAPIALADGHCVLQLRPLFPEGLEINSHAKGRAHFILAGIAAADAGGLVIETHHGFSEQGMDFARFGHEFRLVFEQRENANFNRSYPWVETQHGDRFTLPFVVRFDFFAERRAQNREGKAVQTSRRLDDMRYIIALEKPLAPMTRFLLRKSLCPLVPLLS